MVLALLLWCWFINTSPPGRDWPIAYLPLLNPIDVASGFALLAVLIWRRACAALLDGWPGPEFRSAAVTILGATAFLWANSVIFRTIHFWADIPYRSHSLWNADITQSSLAVFWSVSGVAGMWIGARRGLRTLWFCAAALMGAVVLKLFFVDLANTDTLERVISFLSVGLLMVVVGYFAPAPPRAISAPDHIEAKP